MRKIISLLLGSVISIVALNAQTITLVSPDSADQGQSLTVSIIGLSTNFTQGSGTTVWLSKGFSFISPTSVNIINDLSLDASFDIPINANPGMWDVNVYDDIDGTITKADGFSIGGVGIITVFPDSALVGQSLTVSLTGLNTSFSQGLGTSSVWFSQGSETINAASFTVIDDVSIDALFNIPINATWYWDVNVLDDIDSLITKNYGFYILPPYLFSVVPNTGTRNQLLTVSITGQSTNFSQGSGTYSVFFDQGSPIINALSFNVVNDTSLLATFLLPGTAPYGYYNVVVIDDVDGWISINNGFNIQQLPNIVSGTIFDDSNSNCLPDSLDYLLQDRLVQALPGPKYAISDNSGNFSLNLDSGNYTISLINNDPYRIQTCPNTPPTYSIILGAGPDTIGNVDFAMEPTVFCPNMSVDISTWAIRACMTSTYWVNYCNQGTIATTNATIEVEMDTSMTYTSSTGTLLSQNGNTLIFDIGTVNPGQCGSFQINVAITCNLGLIGSTMCVEAHVYPDSSCFPPDSSWDKSSVSVEGTCVNDSLACFTITNTGDPGNGDMQGTSEYRIYENNMLVSTGTFQLNGGDSTIICWPANNNTIRLEADQRPGHPGNSNPQYNVELCGDGIPIFTTNQILQIPQDDADGFIEMDCQLVTGAYDPNDKQVIPIGLTDTYHYIDSTDELEYQIRFQNTGTDTAFKVVISDTLSPYLDITSIKPGVSSHTYRIDILGSDVLQWTFDNILLPDSNINEPQSHGFLKYKIQQKVGNVLGTVIENNAGIYFDFNPPVITNTVFNTIGDIEALTTPPTQVPEIYSAGYDIRVYPNPFSSTTTFEIGYSKSGPLSFELYNLIGERVKVISEITGDSFILDREYLSDGIYIYMIYSAEELISTGKIVAN